MAWGRVAGHLGSAPQRLGQCRDIPAGSLLVRGRWVDLADVLAAFEGTTYRSVVRRGA